MFHLRLEEAAVGRVGCASPLPLLPLRLDLCSQQSSETLRHKKSSLNILVSSFQGELTFQLLRGDEAEGDHEGHFLQEMKNRITLRL